MVDRWLAGWLPIGANAADHLRLGMSVPPLPNLLAEDCKLA